MLIPGAVIAFVVIALIAYGEYKEWRGQKQGIAMEQVQRIPLIEQECRRRDEYWLTVLRTHQIPDRPVVLQLGDGMELRQKPQPRPKPKLTDANSK